MLRKVRDGLRLLTANLALFSAIILTIWLPVNLIVEYLAFRVPTVDAWAVLRM
jgi:hypothetical protein